MDKVNLKKPEKESRLRHVERKLLVAKSSVKCYKEIFVLGNLLKTVHTIGALKVCN